MGTYDTVMDIPDGYDNQFKCWGSTMEEFNKGDEVGPCGLAETYSIQLQVNDPKKPPYFLIITKNRITDPLAPDPVKGAPVFDKWGKYIGHGGGMLERPEHPMETARATGPWTVKAREPDEPEEPRGRVTMSVPENRKETEKFTHALRLRRNFVVKIKLPADLTEQEAARLASWMEALPLDPDVP